MLSFNSLVRVIFFNFTRLGDEEEGAAETGVTETTREPTIYPHPTNEKIKFWDLPGIGMLLCSD